MFYRKHWLQLKSCASYIKICSFVQSGYEIFCGSLFGLMHIRMNYFIHFNVNEITHSGIQARNQSVNRRGMPKVGLYI